MINSYLICGQFNVRSFVQLKLINHQIDFDNNVFGAMRARARLYANYSVIALNRLDDLHLLKNVHFDFSVQLLLSS